VEQRIGIVLSDGAQRSIGARRFGRWSNRAGTIIDPAGSPAVGLVERRTVDGAASGHPPDKLGRWLHQPRSR
jgi:hypothetical protein